MTTRDAGLRAALRLAGLAGAAYVGLSQWLSLDAHGTGARALVATGALLLIAGGLAPLLHRLPRVAVAGVLALAAVAALAGALLLAGVPLRLLGPRHWSELTAGLDRGISAIPATTVPYRGLDPWVRSVVGLGGFLLVALAALAATRPRGRGVVLAALGVLFAVPAIQLTAASPWLVGAAFAVALVAFVMADRVPLRLAPLGAGTLTAAVLLAMLVAPRLDGSHAIVDVQRIASSLQEAHTDVFDFDHRYGPLDWPRDGRVVLRVRARDAAYWKAADLELFDGVDWRSAPDPNPLLPIAEGVRAHPSWLQRIHVTMGAMRSRSFIAAGETEAIFDAPHRPRQVRPGGFGTALGTLARGDSWDATVYVPRATPRQMAAAGTFVPQFLDDERSMLVRSPSRTSPDARAYVRFGAFGTGETDLLADPGRGPGELPGVLDAAGYGRMYALAKRLAAQSRTPYDLVRRVERYLAADRFVYTEQAVSASATPLPDFLFTTHSGYCQHFSGAMALLLRMGGVPARVVGGFTPGTFDSSSEEYVVRDLDAHSWVEAWFPGLGWQTFDPTPAAAPPRSRFAVADDTGAAASLSEIAADRGRLPKGRRAPVPTAASGAGPRARSGPPWTAITLGLAVLAGLVLAVVARRRRVRVWAGLPPELRELERALARAGRRPPPGTTLRDLEDELGRSDEARAYLRAVRDARFGAGPAPAPTTAQRRALRRQLGAGHGARGRARALYALPPRVRRRRDLH